jgi:photosystem II stability/assembly factor-like uncharacterized protein
LGWVAGADAAMAKTTDGGLTWHNTNWTGAADQSNIQFTDDLNGWTVGNSMFHTSDGGTTWQEVPSPAYISLSAVFFVNNQEGWIAGGNSGILHTINSGGLTPVHKTLVSSPTFSLYPNPAQHLCHLQTTSPVLEATIIDGLGRTHLSVQNPGKTIDVQNLAQGLYWVKVKTAEGVTTQRLVKE